MKNGFSWNLYSLQFEIDTNLNFLYFILILSLPYPYLILSLIIYYFITFKISLVSALTRLFDNRQCKNMLKLFLPLHAIICTLKRQSSIMSFSHKRRSARNCICFRNGAYTQRYYLIVHAHAIDITYSIAYRPTNTHYIQAINKVIHITISARNER